MSQDTPDFEALRASRNAAVDQIISAVANKLGAGGPVHSNFDPNACYCACGNGGPCEHKFEGWRDITDDDGQVCGGEAVCTRCGDGAMSHSMRVGP